MCFDGKRRRPVLAIKYRLREERKKVLDISSAKYYNIEDHETGMRRFCLIRNTLTRLQHDAREEMLARHRISSTSTTYNLEDDILSYYSQPAPSPISALSDDEDDDDLPPPKRLRHLMEDYDKENEKANSCEDRLIDILGDKDKLCSTDDTQNYPREGYESCTGENSSQFRISAISLNSSSSQDSMSLLDLTSKSNIRHNKIFSNNEECTCLPGYINFLRPQHQYPCRFAALVGNDLQSVVY